MAYHSTEKRQEAPQPSIFTKLVEPKLSPVGGQFSKMYRHQSFAEERRSGKGHRAYFLRRLKWYRKRLPHSSIEQDHELVILGARQRHSLLMNTMRGRGPDLCSPYPPVLWQAIDNRPRGQNVGH